MTCNFSLYAECFTINNCESATAICFSNYIDEEIDTKTGHAQNSPIQSSNFEILVFFIWGEIKPFKKYATNCPQMTFD